MRSHVAILLVTSCTILYSVSVCMLCICLLLCVYLSLIVLCPVVQSDNLFLARIYTIFIAVSQFGLVLVAVLLPQPLCNPSPFLSHLKFSAQFRSRESLEVTLICGNHCVYTDTVNFYWIVFKESDHNTTLVSLSLMHSLHH